MPVKALSPIVFVSFYYLGWVWIKDLLGQSRVQGKRVMGERMDVICRKTQRKLAAD
jgi:hypothetical protein